MKRTKVGASVTAVCGERRNLNLKTADERKHLLGDPEQVEDFFLSVEELDVHPAALEMSTLKKRYLETIIEDMRHFGTLGYLPVIVTKVPGGGYFVVKGRTRFEAARAAGVAFMPCKLQKFKSDKDLKAYIQNEELNGCRSFRDC